jgi:hypothetical protein
MITRQHVREAMVRAYGNYRAQDLGKPIDFDEMVDAMTDEVMVAIGEALTKSIDDGMLNVVETKPG